MRYDVGRFRRPMRRSTEGQLMSLISLGDGSTLSLDFTTGVLDPRLTFTRSTNATFINSSGRVQWAAANEFRNTGWVTSTTPTGWNVTFGTGTTTWNNDGTLTMNTGGSSTRPCINANSFTVSQGIAYTFGYTVVSVSGSPQITSVISSTLVGDTFAINGTTVSGTEVVKAGDVVSCTFTPTGTTAIPRMGPGVNAGMTNTAMTITRPQMNPGVSLQSYLANSSTTAANNNTPRFDYDPTSIGTPRGLLIEGAATNICTYSGDMTQSGAGHWTQRVNLDTSAWTGFTAPDGTATAVKLIPNTTNGLHNIQNVSGSLTLVAYTASAFVKADGRTVVGLAIGGSQAWQNFVLTGNGSLGSASTSPAPTSTITPVGSTGWYRVTMTWTSTLSAVGVQLYVTLPQTSSTSPFSAYAGDGTQNGVQAWGYQLELGSGASSYIPTGASQGSRQADVCYIAGSNFTSWFSTGAGTVLAISDNTKSNSQNLIANFSDSTANNYIRMGDNVGGGTNELLLTAVGGSTQGGADSLYNPPLNTVYKTAYAWGLDNFACVANGGTVGTDSTGSVAGSGVITSVTIGLDFYQTSGPNDVFAKNGHIRLFKYWPTRLPNAQLQSITT